MSSNRRDFVVPLGETFAPVFRWGTGEIASAAITGITQAAPMVVTAPGHIVPDGWPAAVVSAQGMTQANATRYPPQNNDWRPATFVNSNSVKFNDINSADFSAYTTGGFLVHPTPMSLVGMTARFVISDAPTGGAVLATLVGGSGVTLDTVAYTISVRLDTSTLTWSVGYYELWMTDGAGTVVCLSMGVINIE